MIVEACQGTEKMCPGIGDTGLKAIAVDFHFMKHIDNFIFHMKQMRWLFSCQAALWISLV
jgi:hypothetical protein